jgi:hypothetical protein
MRAGGILFRTLLRRSSAFHEKAVCQPNYRPATNTGGALRGLCAICQNRTFSKNKTVPGGV